MERNAKIVIAACLVMIVLDFIVCFYRVNEIRYFKPQPGRGFKLFNSRDFKIWFESLIEISAPRSRGGGREQRATD